MNFVIIMAAVSALAIGNSVFFGIYLYRSAKDAFHNKLLALLLFSLALRITKSIIIIAFPNASDAYPAIGLIGMAAIGPLVWLYIQSLFGKELNRAAWLHFLPSALIAMSVAFVDEMIIYRYYQVVILQIFVYILLCIGYLKKNLVELRTIQLKKDWSIRLLIGVGSIWLAFFYQLIADSFISYMIATAVAVVVLYILSYWAMRNGKIFSKVSTANEKSARLNQVAQLVRDSLVEQKLYRDADMTLDKVAKMLHQPPHLLSKAINEVYHQSFPQLLNQFRLEEAKKRLAEDKNKIYSIEAIAYQSGFNTMSSFYATFKKTFKMTPAEYRSKVSL